MEHRPGNLTGPGQMPTSSGGEHGFVQDTTCVNVVDRMAPF